MREGAGSETWIAPGKVRVQGLGLEEPLPRELRQKRSRGVDPKRQAVC